MVMLTTTDNPYDPFTEYEAWLQYDMLIWKNAGASATLGRKAKTSHSLSDEENHDEIVRAIDQIIKEDFVKKFVKLERD